MPRSLSTTHKWLRCSHGRRDARTRARGASHRAPRSKACAGASTLSAGGIVSDFELMELVQDTSSSFAQSLLEELTLRSGLETASLSLFGPTSPFDHVTGLIDRTDAVDVGVRQLVTDYSLV